MTGVLTTVRNHVLLGETYYVTSPFGNRWLSGKWQFHNGVDLVSWGVGPLDTIIAYGDGTVTIATTSSSAGIYVEIDHHNGLKTRYLHMKERYVSVGDEVKKGQSIGYMGNTGNVVSDRLTGGHHLHFDVTKDGKKVDPIPYLEMDNDTPLTPSAPTINDVTQESSIKVMITGSTNYGDASNCHTMCYYSWSEELSDEDVQSGNFYDVVKCEDDIVFYVNKPLSATYLSVIPITIDDDGNRVVGETFGKKLTPSHPSVTLCVDGKLINASPSVYHEDKWKSAVPTIRRDEKWIELYNNTSITL